MGNGTTIPVYLKGLHKSNAHATIEDCEDTKKYIERKLIAIAATKEAPNADGEFWYEHVISEVPSLLEEYGDICFKLILAHRLIEDPDECHDELENIENDLR